MAFEDELVSRLFNGDNVSETVTDADIEYFKIKLAQTKNSVEAEKLRSQIALLESAALIYHERLVAELKRKK